MALMSRAVLGIALLLGGLGFIVSRPTVLLFLDAQSPVSAFVLWYLLFFAYIQAASLVLFHRIDVGTFRGGIGILMLTFAWGIVAYFPASGYALIAIGQSSSQVPSFLLASEDELTYLFWHGLLPGLANYWAGILTYVITPAALGVAAVFVIGPRRILTAFSRLLGLSNGG